MTGHPGIALHVNGCLRADAARGLSDQIARIQVLKRIAVDTFWGSYRYFYGLENFLPQRPEVIMVVVDGQECQAVKAEFPVHNAAGNPIGKKELEVVFTDQSLVGTNYVCATVDENGKIVGE